MSVGWFDSVDITVEVAFASAPLAESPSYTDISQYVRRWSSSAGRQSEYDTFSPRQLQVVLDNRDRRFDPEHSSGPYFGDLVPMKRIRVSAAIGGGAAVVLFTGFVLGWPQQYTNPSDATVTVTAVDGSRFLENAPLAASAYAGEVLLDDPMLYYPMQSAGDQVPLVGSVVLIDQPLEFQYNRTAVDEATAPVGAPAILVPASTAELPFYLGRVNRTLSVEELAGLAAPRAVDMWLRVPVPDDPFQGGAVPWFAFGPEDFLIVSYDGDGVGLYVDYSNSADDVSWTGFVDGLGSGFPGIFLESSRTYHVAVRATATTIHIYVDGVERWSETFAETATSLFGGTQIFLSLNGEGGGISHIAWYATAPAAARFVEHYNTGAHAYGHPMGERSGARIARVLDQIEWPDALRDLDVGETAHGPYLPASQSALSYLRSVESAEQGFVFFDAQCRVALVDRQAIWAGDATPTVFSDDGSDVPYRDVTVDGNTVDAIRNIVDVSYSTGTRRAKDATSITDYGQASETVVASTVDSAALAENLAAYRLRQSKDPATRITSLVVQPRHDPANLFPQIWALELGSRVTVERLPQGVGSRFAKNVIVQGIDHDVTTDDWVTTLYLSPASQDYTEAPYLRLGDATFGKIGAAAGNLIPF